MLNLLLASCAWAPPADTGTWPPYSSLAGQVVVAGAGDNVGAALVMRFDAADPPPPTGFGTPVDMAVVPRSAWSRPASQVMEVADWRMAGVEDGTWLLTALVDVDGDFDPFYDFTAGATCGDRLGAFLAAPEDADPVPLQTTAPSEVVGVEILAGDPLQTERPAFALDPDTPRVKQSPGNLSALSDLGFTLEAHPVDNPLLVLQPSTALACPTRFQLIPQDEDGDGQVDVDPDLEALQALGAVPLVAWPRVYLVFTEGADGSEPAEGESWVAQAVPWVSAGDAADLEPGVPVPMDRLELLFKPGALHTLPGGQEETVEAPDLPQGWWSIAVVNPQGQVWVVPNQLADEELAAALGTQADPTQGAMLEVE